MSNITRQRAAKLLTSAALFAATALAGSMWADLAAAQSVSGVTGCIISSPNGVPVWYQGGGSSNSGPGTDMTAGCDSRAGVNGLKMGNFVTASEVNNAFNTFQQTVTNQINASSGNYGAQIQDLYNRDGAQTTLINNQQTQINNLTQQMGAFSDLAARVTKAEQNITSLDSRVSVHDQTLASHNATLSQQSATLTNHSTRIGSNEDDISSLQGKTTQTNTTVGNQGSQIGQQGSQIGNLETHAAVTDDVIGDMNATLANHGLALADHENRIIKNEADVASIKQTGVFYNTDAAGIKTGGLTLNDGTGKAVQIGNVAAGRTSNDAVNVAQLSSAVDVLGGGAFIKADGTLAAPSYAVGGQTYNTVGDALRATNEIGVQYVVDDKGKATNDIVLRGDGNGPVGIHNVADGVLQSDAATVKQVKDARSEAIAYTDSRVSELGDYSTEQFSKLGGEIASTRREMRSGVSSAMAMAAMRYDSQPGKVAITGGFGSFGGTQSVAAGVGYTSLDGRYRWNAGISRNFGGDNYVGINAGLSVTLD